MNLDLFPAYIALYPEIHYTFDLFFSRLGHATPEILADAPHRLEPGKTIPLLCLVKHADRFPVILKSIKTQVRYEDGTSDHVHLWDTVTGIRQHVWDKVFQLETRKGYCGDVYLETSFEIVKDGVARSILNHNYRGTSRSPLKIHIAEQPLPVARDWYYGEAHCHSILTDDQVEFGAPLEATVRMAEAIGLSWMAVTDHSYDLDDIYGNTLYNDSNIFKWNILQNQIEAINRSGSCHILVGEEVSCGNLKRKNVHVLAYGIRNLIPGSGDGAEPFFRTRPELTIKQVLARIKEDDGVAIAAHPAERFTWGERFLLRRGYWSKDDCQNPDLHGYQFWNGLQNRAFREGYKEWVEMLLNGQRISMIGGDDSHGDFNYFRQIRIPLLTLTRSQDRAFGQIRTCLYCPGGPDKANILDALRQGNVIVTSGPFTAGSVSNEQGETASIGEQISGKRLSASIDVLSTAEFGDIEEIVVYEANLKSHVELARKFSSQTDFPKAQRLDLKDIRVQSEAPGYVRWEARSQKGAMAYHAYANPIWLGPVRSENL